MLQFTLHSVTEGNEKTDRLRMSFTLRRSQSLKTLSGGHSSWSTSELLFWDKRTRSVSQLVQKYESCVELTDVGREEAWSKSSGLRSNHAEIQESKVESLWRRYESLSVSTPTLSKSISMDMLPQPDPTGANSQRTLFESKNALRRDYTSSPWLNVPPQAKMSPVSHITSSEREKGHSSTTTVTRSMKDKTHHQMDKDFESIRRRTVTGVPGYVTRSPSGLNAVMLVRNYEVKDHVNFMPHVRQKLWHVKCSTQTCRAV